MSKENAKSIDDLIDYLRDEKGIKIESSSQKNRLLNIGYYHGYKGYRYIRNASNVISLSSFDELTAIYDFDSKIKQIFYPCIMELETAFKNRTLAIILEEAGTPDITYIYNNLLTEYTEYSDKKRNEMLKRRLMLRNKLYAVQLDAFSRRNEIAVHHLTKSSDLPIWSLFELISLGEYKSIVTCLKKEVRLKISRNLNLPSKFDLNGKLFEKMLEVDRKLRNAIAHNDAIFDTRFCKKESTQLCGLLSNQTNIGSISFNTIIDYLILVIYQLKLIGKPKTDLVEIVSNFDNAINKLKSSVDINIFIEIMLSDNNTKILELRKFISQ